MGKKMTKKKGLLRALLPIGIATVAGGYYYYKNGTGRIVANAYKEDFLIKPEEKTEGTFITLPAGTIGDKVDGVATGFMPGHIYKIPNRLDVEILETGEIKPVNLNVIDKVLFELGQFDYGWRDQTSAWYRSLGKDTSWNDLFYYANEKWKKK